MPQDYQMSLVQATAEEVEDVSALEDALFDNAFGVGTLRRELAVSYAVVARENGEAVGYALVRPNARLHDLLRLGVLPKAQRRGVGTQLLAHVLERFPGEMMLLVRRGNPARRLYEAHGFRVVAQTPESWVMRRRATSTAA